jgi:hypothetical protein
LDTVEGAVKTVNVFDIYFGGQGGFNISKCALQRTHEEALCIPGRNIPEQASSDELLFQRVNNKLCVVFLVAAINKLLCAVRIIISRDYHGGIYG